MSSAPAHSGEVQPGPAVIVTLSVVEYTVLEDRGLLTRILCQDDRRGICTELTAAGRRALPAARPVHDEALVRALGTVAASEELAGLLDSRPDLRPAHV